MSWAELHTREYRKRIHKFNSQHILLPRVIDVVRNVLAMLTIAIRMSGWACLASAGDILDFLVLDFVDAFRNAPLNPKERKYFTRWRFACQPFGTQGQF